MTLKKITNRKSSLIKVYIVLHRSMIDRVYFNHRAAHKRKRQLRSESPHLPKMHYQVVMYTVRGKLGI